MNRLLVLSGVLLACFAQPLRAVDTRGATAGAWTYDVAAARRLADTTDRPLLVMFSNSSGKCAWCNKFEKEINASEEWKIYAAEQQLAMAYINFNGPNWDEAYYQRVCSTNQSAITGFPAFMLYASDGSNVLTSFSYNTTNLAFTAQAFISKIDTALGSAWKLSDQDIWDPGDDTAVGATVLDFQTYNQRQYHTLNDPSSAATDLQDWMKFLCVSGRKYKLQIPPYDYTITYAPTGSTNLTYTNSSYNLWLPTGAASNSAAGIPGTNWLALASNVVVIAESTNRIDSPDVFWLTNSLPYVVQTATNIIVQSSVTNIPPVISNSFAEVHTNLPHADAQVVTNGSPADVIAPSLTLLDPTLQTPLTVDAGPLGYTNSLPLNALTNGWVFTPSSALNNSYCFIRVSQAQTNSIGTFDTESYGAPVTNLAIYTAATNRVTQTVTQEIVSNAWLAVTFKLTNIFDSVYDVPYAIISTNLISLTERRTITATTYEGWSYVTTNLYETTTTNYVHYSYGGTAYRLNYRLWEPGEIVFSPAAVSSSETASSVKLTVTRRNGSTGSAKVSYRLADGTAQAGLDYADAEGELFWADGQTGSTNITIDLIQDLRPTWEGDETFFAALEKHPDAAWFQTAVGSASNAVVTLKESAAKSAGKLAFSGSGDDQDPFANAAKPALTVTEGTPARLWIARGGGSDGPASVTVSTAGGSAVAGTDFIATNATLTWASGESEPKDVAIDTLALDPYSRDKTFTVRLTGASGAALGSPASATVTVRDAQVAASLADTAAAAAAAGAVFKTGTSLWFWSDDARTALCSEPVAPGGKAVLQLTLTGPGLLSFDWEMADPAPQDAMVCAGGVVAVKPLSGGSGTNSVLVKAGRQTVTWTYTRASDADGEADAALRNLVWQPLPKAVNPDPPNGARLRPTTLSWSVADSATVNLGGDFETETNGLAVTCTAAGVYPRGLSAPDAGTSAEFGELWDTGGPKAGASYKWRVDTVFANEDGSVAAAGDTWTFRAIDADEDTGLPPNGGDSDVYEALQGVICDFGEITPAEDGRSYALVGGTLPAGLKLTAATGRIAGIPTKPGTWTVTLQATVKSGVSRTPLNTATFTLTVYPLGTFAGSYTGWTTTDRADRPYSGSGNVTVSQVGDLSAKFIVNGTAYSFSKKGLDSTDNPPAPGSVSNFTCSGASILTSAGKYTNTLDDLSIDDTGCLKATLTLFASVKNSDGTTSPTSTLHQVELFRNNWDSAYMKKLLAAFAGYYTVSLPVAATRDESTAPLGSGYVTLTVGAGGSAKLSGVLADGNAWSSATTLLYRDAIDTNDTSFADKTADVYLYAAPSSYAGSGGLCGLLRITVGGTLYDNTIGCPDGSTNQWWNARPTSVYGATGTAVTDATGFLSQLDAAGGYYDTVMNLQTYYLNKTLTFRDSVLASAPDTATVDRLPSDYDGRNGSSGYALLSEEAGLLPFGTRLVVGAKSLAAAAKSVATNEADLASNSLLDCIDFSESENVAGLTLSLTRATGLLTGAFDLVYERENADGAFARRTRRVSIKGVHTPARPREPADDPSAGVQGAGFYLIPDTGAYLDATGRNISYSFNESFAFELFAQPPD